MPEPKVGDRVRVEYEGVISGIGGDPADSYVVVEHGSLPNRWASSAGPGEYTILGPDVWRDDVWLDSHNIPWIATVDGWLCNSENTTVEFSEVPSDWKRIYRKP